MPRTFGELDSNEKWETVAKVATLLAAIVGGLWSVYTYSHHSAAELRLKRLELNHKFWDRRVEECRDIALAAAQVAINHGREESLNAKFDALYWGASPIIESPERPGRTSLESALANFDETRRNCAGGDDGECWEGVLVCATDISYECTKLICSYLDEPNAVDVCSAARIPQCKVRRNGGGSVVR
jgi:hypothetical protein